MFGILCMNNIINIFAFCMEITFICLKTLRKTLSLMTEFISGLHSLHS